jgi:purine-cytosine permease-like protein
MADMHATARPRSNAARVCTILAFVFAVIAIFFLPPLFGLVGLVLGIVGAVLGDKPLGWYAAAASVVGAILGLVIAAALVNS